MGDGEWRDKRDWPDVPDRHLDAVKQDAVGQLAPTILYSVALLRKVGIAAGEGEFDAVRSEAHRWSTTMVNVATDTDAAEGTWPQEARKTLVKWGKRADQRWPDESWWWSPLGLTCVAWAEDGTWAHLSNGQVPQWLPAATIARHAGIADRTVRRWGDNRKRVRQRGTVDGDKRRLYHRHDVAKLIVMRYGHLGS